MSKQQQQLNKQITAFARYKLHKSAEGIIRRHDLFNIVILICLFNHNVNYS